jgi:hypothetical protein
MTWSATRRARLDPFAQNPKETRAFGAIVRLWVSGVTRCPLNRPFHRLFTVDSLKSMSTDQLVMGELPPFLMNTSAQ